MTDARFWFAPGVEQPLRLARSATSARILTSTTHGTRMIPTSGARAVCRVASQGWTTAARVRPHGLRTLSHAHDVREDAGDASRGRGVNGAC